MLSIIFDEIQKIFAESKIRRVSYKQIKQKQEETPVVEEVKEEQKQEETPVVEEVKEEQKPDEIEMLLQYVRQIEDEMIMEQSIEELLSDKELLEKYNDEVEYIDDGYDEKIVNYEQEKDYLNEIFKEELQEECKEVEKSVESIEQNDKVVNEITQNSNESHEENNEKLDEINKTLSWMENVMNSAGNVEELFNKCNKNKEE